MTATIRTVIATADMNQVDTMTDVEVLHLLTEIDTVTEEVQVLNPLENQGNTRLELQPLRLTPLPQQVSPPFILSF